MTFNSITMAFRSLSRDEKFDSLTELANKLGRIPKHYDTRSYTPNDYERVRGQFYVNMKSKRTRSELPKNDLKRLAKFEHKFIEPKQNSNDLIDIVYNFYLEMNRLPEMRQNDPIDIVSAWRYIRTASFRKKPVPESHQGKMRRIRRVAILKQNNRSQRLRSLLKFCTSHKRTPKQHSLDLNEKKLADFLSTTKQYRRKHSLNTGDETLFRSIIEYAPNKDRYID